MGTLVLGLVRFLGGSEQILMALGSSEARSWRSQVV